VTHPYTVIADDLRNKAGQILALSENSPNDDELTATARVADELAKLAVELELLGSVPPQREKLLRMLADSHAVVCAQVGGEKLT